MTAFYVFRAMFMTFFGSYRGHAHPHESPAVMMGSARDPGDPLAGRRLPVPDSRIPGSRCSPRSKRPKIIVLMYDLGRRPGLIGIALAYLMYVVKPGMADSLAGSLQRPLHTCSTTSISWMKSTTPPWSSPLVGGSRVVLWKGVDAGLIDGIVNGVGARARDVGSVLRLLQSGNIRSYATWVLFGSVAVIVAHRASAGGCPMNLLTVVLVLPLVGFLSPC